MLMNYNRTFFDSYINKTCKLLIVTKNEQINHVKEIAKEFMKMENKVLVFDLEFSTTKTHGRQMAIIQLGFHIGDELIIVFFDPNTTPNIMNTIEPLLIDTDIAKVGHGTDSLDVPALYKLFNDDVKMTAFLLRLYDTRFLCEYINVITEQKRCNIYHCLELFNVVDQSQIEYLHNVEKNLGKLWFNSPLNITKLSENIITYAMYDVVYLKHLLVNLKTQILDLKLDYNVALHVTRLMLLVRIGIVTIPDVNEFNTYYTKSDHLKKLFEDKVNQFTNSCSLEFQPVLKSTLFKKYIHAILIPYFYMSLTTKIIHKSKSELITKSDIDKLHSVIMRINRIIEPFPKIISLVQEFQSNL